MLRRSTHDNWERLLDAVLKRELFRKLCHQDSIDSSFRSSASSSYSGRSSSFRSSFSFQDSYSVNPESGLLKYGFPFRDLYRFKAYEQDHGALMFSESAPFQFGFEELLWAPSSTVLGDEVNNFHNIYLVSLTRYLWLVVTRFERRALTQEKFENYFKTIHSINHENVMKLRANYLSKTEAFGIYDYFPQGSLHTMLHGRRSEAYLDWNTRTKVAIGAARGLVHIHSLSSGTFVHGCVKASNIFLNTENYGLIGGPNPKKRESKHHPLEVLKKGTSQESDVYSFGVLLFELITGKSPMLFTSGRFVTFADWALHNACDGLSTLVFDKELLKDSLVMHEMWEMLGVAMQCLEKKPEKRPKMKDVVEMLQFLDRSQQQKPYY